MLIECRVNIGCMPYISKIVDSKGEKEPNKWYLTREEFRKTYKDYSNWEQYQEVLVGNPSQDLMKQVKKIVKLKYDMGYSKIDTIIRIYGLINKDEVVFPENEEDMITAEILYDIANMWIIRG